MITINHLLNYKKNNTSQYGEDGMIEEILRRLDINTGVVVDIGANDGKWYSNTYSLLERGFTVYGVEANTAKYKDMCKLKNQFPNLHPIHAKITTDKESPSHINNILKKYNIPDDIDFMSIDIDSIDAWVFEDLSVLPKFVVIEVESSHYPLDMIWYDPNFKNSGKTGKNGTSFLPIYKIAKNKGYHLVGHSNINSFYVRNDLIKTLNYPEATDVCEFSNFYPNRLNKVNFEKWKNWDGKI